MHRTFLMTPALSLSAAAHAQSASTARLGFLPNMTHAALVDKPGTLELLRARGGKP